MNQVCIKRSFFKLIERIIYYLLLILALDRPLCDVGHFIQDHKRCEGEVISSETSHENSRELIILRTNLTVKESFNICDYHRNRFLDKYSFFEKYCCDLFNQHNKNCIGRRTRVLLLVRRIFFCSRVLNKIFAKKRSV